jgi:hypothetical protein
MALRTAFFPIKTARNEPLLCTSRINCVRLSYWRTGRSGRIRPRSPRSTGRASGPPAQFEIPHTCEVRSGDRSREKETTRQTPSRAIPTGHPQPRAKTAQRNLTSLDRDDTKSPKPARKRVEALHCRVWQPRGRSVEITIARETAAGFGLGEGKRKSLNRDPFVARRPTVWMAVHPIRRKRARDHCGNVMRGSFTQSACGPRFIAGNAHALAGEVRRRQRFVFTSSRSHDS